MKEAGNYSRICTADLTGDSLPASGIRQRYSLRPFPGTLLKAALLWAAAFMLLGLLLAGCGDQAADRYPTVSLKFVNQALYQQALLETMISRNAVRVPANEYMATAQRGQRLGSIEIPRIGVREWIVQGTEDDVLKLGAGHIAETPMPGLNGNFTIAGDRVLYTAPFLRLDSVEPGDEITVEMPYGRFIYEVEKKTVNSPTDISVLYPKGYDSLTLSTCEPPWGLGSRLTISARLSRVRAGAA